MKVKTDVLNSREVKKFNELVRTHWGVDFGREFAFLKSSKDKVYAITKEVGNIDLEALNIFSMGLYIATWNDKGLRLSLEGARLLGAVTKNFVKISDEQTLEWMRGHDLELSEEQVEGNSGFLIVIHGEDCLGCGRLSENKLFNLISKGRKVNV